LSDHRFEGTTVAQAREFVSNHAKAGIECPCCDQRVKIYGRSLHSSMAAVLLSLHKHFRATRGLDWLHVSEFPPMPFNINGDYSYLRHWGMLDQHPEHVGYWRVTPYGHAFCESDLAAPKTVFLKNNKKVGVSENMTTLKQALGDKFKDESVENTNDLRAA
jgi:hypothetical protein